MRVVGILVVALLLVGCRSAERQVLYDLVEEARVARQHHPGGVRTILSPPETLYWTRPRGRQNWTQPRLVSNVILQWSALGPREVGLDLEPPDWGSGEALVTFNRTRLGTLSLGSEREWHTLALPAGAQRKGRNRLRLIFPCGESCGTPPPPGPPPRLLGLSVQAPGGEGPSRSVHVRSGPGGRPALGLAAGFGLEYALRLPEEAELRFTPRLPEGPSEGARYRVELTLEGEPTRQPLSLDVRGGDAPPEIRLPLEGAAGRPALLGLHVSGGRGSTTVAEWGAPRVLGVPRADVGGTEGSAAPAAQRLRERLQGRDVLLIVLDAAAARHFGCYGYPRDTTPHLDRLASEGVLFEEAYSPASYTGVAMASLWTSQHPEQHHHGGSPRDRLPRGRLVLSQLLTEAGIPSTAFIGNMVAGELTGLTRGFTEVKPLRLTVKKGRTSRSGERPLFDLIAASISAGGPEPSLTYLHYLEPHFPYDPPPPFDTAFGPDAPLPPTVRRDPSWIFEANAGRREPTAEEIAHLARLYDGNLAAVDHEIGRLREHLEARGLWEDLVVIVTADHGESFREHGHLTHAAQVYQESIKIPLIVRLPGDVRPRRVDQPVDLLDVGATLADVFGVLGAARPHFEGRSPLPSVVGHPLAPRDLVARTLAERPVYSLYDGRLKLLHDPSWGRSELYDLREDPFEGRDLSRERPVAVELLRQSLYRWLRDLDRGEAAREPPLPIDPETAEALRALGYVE